MKKGSNHTPVEYFKCQQVAPGRYIQNIIVTREPDLTWVAVNNKVRK